MNSFGLISEGITDEVVINNVLMGYFDVPDIDITPLTPVRDETDQSRVVEGGGWYSVIEYVKSSKFEAAFGYLDYVIIHIDTDVCEEPYFNVPRRENGAVLDAFQLIEKVRERFRTWMGEQVFERRRRQIFFAIAVDSIECWLLPLFYEHVKSKREKTANCLTTLNRALNKKYGFTIHKKEREYYDRASTDYNHQPTLRRLHEHNPSLKAFIEELDRSEIGQPLRE